MPILPLKSDGRGGQREQAHDRVVEYLKSLRPMRGAGTHTQHTAFGVVRQSAAAIQARRTDLFFGRITALYNADYFGAMLYDDAQYDPAKDFVETHSTAGDPSLSQQEFLVAKNLTGRMVPAATIDTYEIEYTYDGENDRNAVATMLGSEQQVCHPRYQLGDFIILTKVQNGAGAEDGRHQTIYYYEISPARFWCARPQDYTPPSGGGGGGAGQ